MSSSSIKTLENAREFWAKIAKKNGWYKEPFFVQVWRDESGKIVDCVSHRDLDRDIEVKY